MEQSDTISSVAVRQGRKPCFASSSLLGWSAASTKFDHLVKPLNTALRFVGIYQTLDCWKMDDALALTWTMDIYYAVHCLIPFHMCQVDWPGVWQQQLQLHCISFYCIAFHFISLHCIVLQSMKELISNQVFDNSSDSCTTNYSLTGQPQSCTEAFATSQDLFHFVFDQVELSAKLWWWWWGWFCRESTSRTLSASISAWVLTPKKR